MLFSYLYGDDLNIGTGIYRTYFLTDSYRKENRSRIMPDRNRFAGLNGPNQFLFGITNSNLAESSKSIYYNLSKVFYDQSKKMRNKFSKLNKGVGLVLLRSVLLQ